MTKSTHTKEAIRAAMDHLIDRATRFAGRRRDGFNPPGATGKADGANAGGC